MKLIESPNGVSRFHLDRGPRRIALAVTTVAAVAALVYTVYGVGPSGIENAARRIGWGFLGVLALSALREAARAWAWMRATEGPVPLRLRDALPARLAGEALNALLPMGVVVGEPAKAEYVSDRLPFSTAFNALLLELTFYCASLALVFAAGAAVVVPPALLLTTALLIVPGVMCLRKARRLFGPVLVFARRHPGRVCHIAVLEIAYHSLGILEAYVTLTLLGVGAAFTAALLLETVNRGVTIAFKMVPLRIGIDEAASAMTAHALSLGTGIGVAIALVRKVRVLVWSAVGLVILLARSARTARVRLAAQVPVRP